MRYVVRVSRFGVPDTKLGWGVTPALAAEISRPRGALNQHVVTSQQVLDLLYSQRPAQGQTQSRRSTHTAEWMNEWTDRWTTKPEQEQACPEPDLWYATEFHLFVTWAFTVHVTFHLQLGRQKRKVKGVSMQQKRLRIHRHCHKERN